MTQELSLLLLRACGVVACTSEPIYPGTSAGAATSTGGCGGSGHTVAATGTGTGQGGGSGGAQTHSSALATCTDTAVDSTSSAAGAGSTAAQGTSTSTASVHTTGDAGASGTPGGTRCVAPETPPSRALALLEPAFRGLQMRYP